MVRKWKFSGAAVGSLKRDRGFVMELVHGSLRQQAVMVWLEQRWVKRTRRLDSGIIHVGFYQLLFLDEVEVYAAINECVEAANVSRMDWVQQVGEWSFEAVRSERSAIQEELAKESETAVRFRTLQRYYQGGRRLMVWSRLGRWRVE